MGSSSAPEVFDIMLGSQKQSPERRAGCAILLSCLRMAALVWMPIGHESEGSKHAVRNSQMRILQILQILDRTLSARMCQGLI